MDNNKASKWQGKSVRQLLDILQKMQLGMDIAQLTVFQKGQNEFEGFWAPSTIVFETKRSHNNT